MNTAADYRQVTLTCRRCPDHYHADEFCPNDPFGCPYYKALTSGPARDLQVSGVPDPLVTGPSIRAAMAAGTRRARLWAWLRAHEVEALMVFAVIVFAAVLLVGGER